MGDADTQNCKDFNYNQFAQELKDIPTGISKVVYERYLNQDVNYYKGKLQEMAYFMKLKHQQEQSKKEKDRLQSEILNKGKFHLDAKQFRQNLKRPVYTFQSGYMTPGKALLMEPPTTSFGKVLEYYKPLIEQKNHQRENAANLFQGSEEEDEKILNEEFNGGGGYGFVKPVNKMKSTYDARLREFQKQKYTLQMENLDQMKMPEYEQAYAESKSIFKDGQPKQATILGNNKEYTKFLEAGKTPMQKGGHQVVNEKKFKQDATIQQFLKQRRDRLNKFYQNDQPEIQQKIGRKLGGDDQRDDPEFFQYSDKDQDDQLEDDEQQHIEAMKERSNFLRRFKNQRSEVQVNDFQITSEEEQQEDSQQSNIQKFQLDTVRTGSSLETAELENLEEEMRFGGISQNKESLMRELKPPQSARSNNSKRGGGLITKKKQRRVVQIKQPTTAEVINYQLNRDPAEIEAERLATIKETNEEKRLRLLREKLKKELEDRTIAEEKRVQQIIQEARGSYNILKSYRAQNNNNLQQSSIESMQSTVNYQLTNENSDESVNLLPQANLGRKFKLDTAQAKTMQHNQPPLKSPKSALRNPSVMKIIENEKSPQKVMFSNENIKLENGQLSSRRPVMVDDDLSIKDLNKVLQAGATPRSLMLSNETSSQLMLHKNIKAINGPDIHKIMYSEGPKFSKKEQLVVKAKQRKKVRRVSQRESKL